MKYKIFIRLLLGIFILIQLWTLYLTFNYPVGGISVSKNKEWTVVEIDRSSMTSQLGLKVGDIIIEINGIKASEYPSVIKWGSVAQAKKILISRDGKIIKISTNGISPISLLDVYSLLGELISLLFAFFLYKKMPRSQSIRHLSAVFINIGIIFMSLMASIRGDVLGKILITTYVALLPITFLHFLIVFLNEKGNIQLRTKFLKYLYAIVLFAFIIMLAYFLGPPISNYVYDYSNYVIILIFIFGLLLNFLLLSYVSIKYRKDNMYISTIIKMVWLSLFISFAPITCLSFIPEILYRYDWVNSLYTSWFVLFFPISFAYLIATNKLYDIDMIVRRILFTGGISIIPSGIFMGINRILFPNDATFPRLLVALILFVVILTFVLYSLEYFTTRLEPIMFPRKYQLQKALKKISKNLGSISSFRELKNIFLVDIVNTLQVFGGAIVFKYNDTVEIISEGEIEESEVEEFIGLEELEHPLLSLFEINRHEEFTSYLIMTQKKTKTLLGSEETQWLNLIITYLAVSLENVHLIRKLTMKLERLASYIPNEEAANDFNWFRKLMFELQEKERVRIATDLHDTTMQDLFFLKERLHSLLEKYAFSPDDLDQMNSIIGYIDVINANLRQSCFELHPHLLKEIGLVQTIEQLVDFEMAISSFEIEFHATRAYLIEQRDLDIKRHIFRMVQELINNAKKHSQASRIKINLTAANNSICLDYEDDGVGFEESQPAISEIGASGVGMNQMKSRILSLNGHFELETSKGKGMKLMATFPMREGQTV
ncbi:MAG: ATPase/histidine kinase/DNA gyrase domain protein [Bacilli bacterium]|nr:ATPase/histidine kinase/DNA gyrase domain protein [Bacilli bacterium]